MFVIIEILTRDIEQIKLCKLFKPFHRIHAMHTSWYVSGTGDSLGNSF